MALGLAAYLLSNLGMGVQKAGACGFVARRRGPGIWFAGTAMTVVGAILLFPAYGLARASVVAPLEGLGLAALALFASRVLREPWTRTHRVALGLIVLGTVLTGRVGALPKQASEAFRPLAFAWGAGLLLGTALLLVLLLALPGIRGFFRERSPGAVGVLLGGAAGTCAGVAMVLQKVVGGTFLAAPTQVLQEPYLFLFFLVAGIGFVTQQVAWLHGTAVEVVGTYSSMALLVPAGTAWALFGEPFTVGLALGLGLVVLGVVLLAGQAAAIQGLRGDPPGGVPS
jgi:uncharacterized membrane protein